MNAQVLAWTFPAGKLVQSVTSVTVVNNTPLTINITVPAGELWILLSVKVVNPDNVNRIIDIHKWKEAAKTNRLAFLDQATITPASHLQWPNTVAAQGLRHEAQKPSEMLAEGNTLEFIWAAGGASTGGTDADGLVIEYLKIGV